MSARGGGGTRAAARGGLRCALLEGARPPPADGTMRSRESGRMRATTLLPDMPPSSQALLRSQPGPQAGAWLAAIVTEPATTLPPPAMQIVLRRRLRQPHSNTCAPPHSCGGAVGRFGDHAIAYPRTGLLARRAKIVAGEAMGIWGRKGKSFRSSGWPTPPPRMSERRTVAGSTSSCTGR